MFLSARKLSALTLATATFALAACSSDDNPTENTVPPVLGVQATAASTSSIVCTCQSRTGDNSYNIERAQGATGGTFAQVGTAPAPATVGTVTYTDNGLALNTAYRYRVTAVRGTQSSAPSS